MLGVIPRRSASKKNKFRFDTSVTLPRGSSILSFGLDSKSWYVTVRYIAFAIAFGYYLYIAADLYGSINKKKILRQEPISIEFVDNEIKEGRLIGKTKDVSLSFARSFCGSHSIHRSGEGNRNKMGLNTLEYCNL